MSDFYFKVQNVCVRLWRIWRERAENEGDTLCGKIQSRIRYFYRNLTVNFTNITDYSIQLDKIIETTV